jgi:hypothetical protein
MHCEEICASAKAFERRFDKIIKKNRSKTCHFVVFIDVSRLCMSDLADWGSENSILNLQDRSCSSLNEPKNWKRCPKSFLTERLENRTSSLVNPESHGEKWKC